MINVNIRDRAGAVLKTSGKYCKEDILISPVIQDKVIEITRNGFTDVTADSGYCALGNTRIKVDIPVHGTYTNAEGVSF